MEDNDQRSREHFPENSPENFEPRLAPSLAGLNMERFIESIRFNHHRLSQNNNDNNNGSGTSSATSQDDCRWVIGTELGSLMVCYNGQNNNEGRVRRINNIKGYRFTLLSRMATVSFWEKLQAKMNQNRFVLVTVGQKATAVLYYCHRIVFRLRCGQRLLLFAEHEDNFPVLINGVFVDSCFDTWYHIEPMQHIRLKGRPFKIRISSHRHCIYVRNDDFVQDSVSIKWIQSIPKCESDEEDDDKYLNFYRAPESTVNLIEANATENQNSNENNNESGRMTPEFLDLS